MHRHIGIASHEAVVVKDGEREVSVPEVWRPTLVAIVDALVEGRAPSLPHVAPREPAMWAGIQESIRAYGAHLRALPNEAWDASVCIWYGEVWDVLVDLYTEEEGRSDLVLHLHIRELDGEYRYEVVSAYVP